MRKPTIERLLDFAVEVRDTDYQPNHAFISREVVQATLPHKNPGDVPAWSRVNGNYALTVQPGWDTWNKRSFGYPYGTVPRLLIFWLTTEALKTGSKRLEIGGSLAEFMRKLGMDASRGGKRSDAKRLRDQMERLFRARISFEYRDEREQSWYNLEIAPKGMMWWQHDLATESDLWENWVELSDDFFKAITNNPVPVDMNALQHLKRSALALDLYAWLTHETFRSSSNDKSRQVSWRGLHQQFGADYADIRNFSRKVLEALEKIQVVFPGLEVETLHGGILINPGEPAIPRKTISVPAIAVPTTPVPPTPVPEPIQQLALSPALPSPNPQTPEPEPELELPKISDRTLKTATKLIAATDLEITDLECEYYAHIRRTRIPKNLSQAFLAFVRRRVKSRQSQE